ncbi:MAG TPA: PqqD family protein [Caulifigura sp.]|nr:PqqD family protein [Caulifigura sp.]
MTIELTQRFVKSRAVLAQDLLEGDSVLLHVDSGQYFGLDPVGNEAWKVLSTGATLEDTRDQLLQKFDVSPDQLLSDLTALIDELKANGLLENAGP